MSAFQRESSDPHPKKHKIDKHLDLIFWCHEACLNQRMKILPFSPSEHISASWGLEYNEIMIAKTNQAEDGRSPSSKETTSWKYDASEEQAKFILVEIPLFNEYIEQRWQQKSTKDLNLYLHS